MYFGGGFAMAQGRFQVSIDDELATRIDEYADEHYMTRSGVIALACQQLLLADDVRKAIGDLSVSMRRIADNNKIDEQSIKELEHFETFAKMYVSTFGS